MAKHSLPMADRVDVLVWCCLSVPSVGRLLLLNCYWPAWLNVLADRLYVLAWFAECGQQQQLQDHENSSMQ
jgi:hypothetical protein